MILGAILHGKLRLCAVKAGNPESMVDGDEPERLGCAVKSLGLRHAA